MCALWQVLALWLLRRKKPRVGRLVELFCLAVPAGDALCRWQVQGLIAWWPLYAALPKERTYERLLRSVESVWQFNASLSCTTPSGPAHSRGDQLQTLSSNLYSSDSKLSVCCSKSGRGCCLAEWAKA